MREVSKIVNGKRIIYKKPDVYKRQLSRQYPWLKMSVMIFDVTIVGDEYNLLPIIKDET